jgi:hypothetical protein
LIALGVISGIVGLKIYLTELDSEPIKIQSTSLLPLAVGNNVRVASAHDGLDDYGINEIITSRLSR